jgi:hypothetical protein
MAGEVTLVDGAGHVDDFNCHFGPIVIDSSVLRGLAYHDDIPSLSSGGDCSGGDGYLANKPRVCFHLGSKTSAIDGSRYSSNSEGDVPEVIIDTCVSWDSSHQNDIPRGAGERV